MRIDLCALTADLLPLYLDDLLSPETRQLVEEHAAGCPTCRERLQAAGAPLPPSPWLESPMERPGRLFSARLRRILFYGLVGCMVLLIGAGSLGYALGRKRPWEQALIPARVSGAEEVATRAIPGWKRAEASGLVVDLGITETIPGTQATITLEKGWYSGRQAYILYTVKGPKDGYVMPTRVQIWDEEGKKAFGEGATDWNHLSVWGGFSPEGFHSVIVFGQFSAPVAVQRLKLSVLQWAPVTPEVGMVQTRTAGMGINTLLPWRAEYLQEPSPEVLPLTQRHTWMGRTLALERLEVGVGRTKLTGQIELPLGERKPTLMARLKVGGKGLDLKEFKAEPAGAPGLYQFSATFDGPDQWPAPVKLELLGINFETDKTLEWPVNWAKYRDLDGSQTRLMDRADQVSVRFYDSELVSIATNRRGVAIEQKEPKGAPPYVRASLAIGGRGRGPDSPGMEVMNDRGEVLTDLGGGGGVIYDDAQGHDQRQGVAVYWDELPPNFRQSDRLMVRYVYPSATLILNETWDLQAVR